MEHVPQGLFEFRAPQTEQDRQDICKMFELIECERITKLIRNDLFKALYATKPSTVLDDPMLSLEASLELLQNAVDVKVTEWLNKYNCLLPKASAEYTVKMGWNDNKDTDPDLKGQLFLKIDLSPALTAVVSGHDRIALIPSFLSADTFDGKVEVVKNYYDQMRNKNGSKTTAE